jgi:hypothetical protein
MTDRSDQGAASGLLGELESIRALLEQNRRLQAGEPAIELTPEQPGDAEASLADDEIPLLQDEIADWAATASIQAQDNQLEHRLENLVDDWLETAFTPGLQASLQRFLQTTLQHALQEWLDDHIHNEMQPLRDQLLDRVREGLREEARQLDALRAPTPSSTEKTHGQ